MSARRSFIKNSLMALAVSLLPKVLRPMDVGVIEEEDSRFMGLYRYGNVVNYEPGNFTIDDFHELVRKMDERNRRGYISSLK